MEAFAALIPVNNHNVYITKYLLYLNAFAVTLLANLKQELISLTAGVASCHYFNQIYKWSPQANTTIICCSLCRPATTVLVRPTEHDVWTVKIVPWCGPTATIYGLVMNQVLMS
jgi:hypothetical protein